MNALVLRQTSDRNSCSVISNLREVVAFSLLLGTLKGGSVTFLRRRLCSGRCGTHGVSGGCQTLRQHIDGPSLRTDRRRGRSFCMGRQRYEELRRFMRGEYRLVIIIASSISRTFRFFSSRGTHNGTLCPRSLLGTCRLHRVVNVRRGRIREVIGK